MTIRSTQSQIVEPANLSVKQIEAALPKLRRRIDDLRTFDLSTVRNREDFRFDSLVQKIDATFIEIFGPMSVEYQNYRIYSLDTADVNMYEETPLKEIIAGYGRGIERAISQLQTIIDLFQEKLSDSDETTEVRAVRTFDSLDLHPEIVKACSKLFLDGHYANAVEDACKVLDQFVKIRSGKDGLSGTELMLFVFSPKSPILKFNDLQTDTHKSEQQGMMYLYAGAMLALRNPRAHELVADDPERALEYLGFLSLLVKSLDRAKRE